MRRLEVLVIRGELQRHVEAVPPWEVPILELVHRGQIEIVGESECSAPIPSPEQEYERLRQKYRQNKETLIPRVEEIYGAGAVGIRNLAAAMKDQLEEQALLDEREAEAATMVERALEIDWDAAKRSAQQTDPGKDPAAPPDPTKAEEQPRRRARASG